MRGLPPPERLVKKNTRAGAARVLEDNVFAKESQAEVSKVEACSLAEYDGGRGLQKVFAKGDSKARCNIICNGDTSKLTISLEIAEKHRDPQPRVLHRIELPNDDYQIGLRLYDVDVSMEIREHPMKPKQRKSTRRAEFGSGKCWVVHLVTPRDEQLMLKAKRMLRRLESVTCSMPSEWFTYRNYLVKDPSGQSANSGIIDVRDGVFTQTFAGGYTWRFNGNLASEEFQQALMGKSSHKTVQEEVPTRAQPFRAARGAKAAKKIPKKQVRLNRVQQRAEGPHEPSQEISENVGQQEPKPPQPEGVSPAMFSSESDFERAGSESDDSDKSFEIEGLLDKRTTDDGEIEYEVNWTGPFVHTWVLSALISPEAIAEFEKDNASKAKKGKPKTKKRKPKAKKGSAKASRQKQMQTSAANAPRTRSAVKATNE